MKAIEKNRVARTQAVQPVGPETAIKRNSNRQLIRSTPPTRKKRLGGEEEKR